MSVTTTPRFDRSFDQLVSSFFDGRRATGPVIDAAWNGDAYVLTVDLPGVPASAVGVEVSGSTLTVSAHTEQLDWTRSLRLGGKLDPEKVSATHVDGRLTVRIGTVDAPIARKVEVATVADTPAIEAQSIDAEPTGTQVNETSSGE